MFWPRIGWAVAFDTTLCARTQRMAFQTKTISTTPPIGNLEREVKGMFPPLPEPERTTKTISRKSKQCTECHVLFTLNALIFKISNSIDSLSFFY
ncbi:hypothetical protein C5E22_09465 [Pectobacterium parmentieri]|uniref:Uncharacterized protein n=1 Tax=Pectobacterium parmentieri TaxID=1905730 RepID=A0A8B3FE14_PECPM|nr:hypothetical protein A8F97_05700 [Pectobacterium parmentieri]AYH06044.1 hypothetical protein C5E25_12145 [Pectobacterium parmentieri]AYH10594.1 hypothetical protein C5E24_13325 [Pectobacterium parmentieri]AYH18695.1 hypothetical protein C5E22_09465 [Pectobacterium parmentieri]AYH36875.1 hypothetical protein C5E17_13070 [Pectobacterium parmentieri]